MKTYEEIRVYGIDVYLFVFEPSPTQWENEKFIDEAEIQGNVWSLDGFEDAFNISETFSNRLIIRII